MLFIQNIIPSDDLNNIMTNVTGFQKYEIRNGASITERWCNRKSSAMIVEFVEFVEFMSLLIR